MLANAMDAFQIAKRAHSENTKGQYLDKNGKNGAKNYFRASELGSADRKIIYSFFAHQLPKKPLNAKSLRIFENGDYVHDRYQSAWDSMGALISMEERLSSRDDEYLAEFDWEWAGHYDGLLDLNIVRAHALGLVHVGSTFNEDTSEWELDVELDEAYANSIGIFDADGNIADDYAPPTLLADIKTMNPWGFKKIKDNGDVSNIGGYLDQISFYMYMKNTPYGSIYVESKDNNDVVEVQVLWKDLHEGVEYTWDKDIHGEQNDKVVRVVITSDRFFGSDAQEGCVPRLQRLWTIAQALKEADEKGDQAAMAELFPERCADKPDSFPCSWGHKTGTPSYCEFYEHCYSNVHDGKATRTIEAIPEEAKWVFEAEEASGELEIIIDNRKVPSGIDYDGFIQLVEMGALDYTMFLAEVQSDQTPSEAFEAEQEVLKEGSLNTDNLFDATGSLNLGIPADDRPTVALEYLVEGERAIDCLNCGKQVTYKRLGNGGTKKCTHCNHTNRVQQEEAKEQVTA